jgi:hypothetical protein
LDSFVPRYQLPDTWSGKGVCPVCRSAGSLRVAHQAILPDRMECAVCGAAFEMQSGGTHIRLQALPDTLSGRASDLLDTWLMPGEVPTIGPLGSSTTRPDEPFAQDLLPPASATTAARVDNFAADLLPPAPPPGTSPLRRGTGQLTLRTGATGSLSGATPNARPVTGPLPKNFGTAPLTPPAGAKPAMPPVAPPAASRPTTAPLSPLPDRPPARPTTPMLSALPANPVAVPPPAGPPARPTTAPLTPLAGAKPPSVPPPQPPTATASTVSRPAEAQPPAANPDSEPRPPSTITLHEELDGVLNSLPPRPARSDEALADELAVLLSGLPAVAPEPAAPGSTGPAVVASAPANGAAPAHDEATGVVSTQPLMRVSRLEAAVEVELETAAETEAAAKQILDKARVAEFSEQARKLHLLGNSIDVIRTTLERSTATPAEARAALASIARVEAARQRRFRQTLQLVGGGALVILLLLIAVALVIGRPVPGQAPVGTTAAGQPSAAPPAGTATPSFNPVIELINNVMPQDVRLANGPSPSPGPTSVIMAAVFPPTPTLDPAVKATEAAVVADSGLPDWVRQLVPEGITVINVPTPSVDDQGPPISDCPSTATAAEALFGGRSNDWSYHGDTGGWILVLADNPATIRVPANMSAGYLVLGNSLEMRSALGPATIHNVNFVAISCS